MRQTSCAACAAHATPRCAHTWQPAGACRPHAASMPRQCGEASTACGHLTRPPAATRPQPICTRYSTEGIWRERLSRLFAILVFVILHRQWKACLSEVIAIQAYITTASHLSMAELPDVVCVLHPGRHGSLHELGGPPRPGSQELAAPRTQRGCAGAPPGEGLLRPAPAPPLLALSQPAPAPAEPHAEAMQSLDRSTHSATAAHAYTSATATFTVWDNFRV